MATMNQMREALIKAYPGPRWTAKVNKMTDSQVFATYTRLKLAGRIK